MNFPEAQLYGESSTVTFNAKVGDHTYKGDITFDSAVDATRAVRQWNTNQFTMEMPLGTLTINIVTSSNRFFLGRTS